MDDDDDFLYGGGGALVHSEEKAAEPESRQSYTPEPMNFDGATEPGGNTTTKDIATAASPPSGDAGEDDDEEMDEESSEDDVEIITEPTSNALTDAKYPSRPFLPRPPATAAAAPIHPVHLTTEYTPLGRDREAVNHPPVKKPQPPSAPPKTPALAVRPSTPIQQTSGDAPIVTVQMITDASNPDVRPESIKVVEDGVDPKTLPSVRALSNAPALIPSAPGMLDGRSIYEVDIASLESKAWRRPGADLSDWFNYGFDEISWEAYCKRREIMGDMADKLKINVLNFANLTEEQFLNAAEARKPAILGAHLASMQMGGGPDVKPGMGVGMGGGAGPNVGIGAGFGGGMMGPQGGNMNMGMPGPGGPGGVQDMGGMGMGMMGMGMPMGGDMGMQDVVDGGPGGMGMDFGSSGPGIGGPMAMAMGGDFMGDTVMMGSGGTPFGGHGSMEPNQGVGGGPGPGPGPGPSIGNVPPTAPAAMSGGGGTPIRQLPIPGAPTGPAASLGGSGAGTSFVGATPPTGPAATRNARGAPPPAPRAARGAFRGRGRGAGFDTSGIPPRATSPLPPNVPTGPRSQHRYKDRDTNAPATEPLDYGADAGDRDRDKDREGRSSTRERDRDRDRYDKDDKDDDRKSRKRRASPSDDGRERTSKRR